jgi:hypothetical protein
MSTYEGWKNYETWLVKLWLDNEPYTYYEMQELARLHEGEAYALSQAIEETVQGQMAEQMPHAGLVNDLAMSALSEVDWMEIAESYLEELEQDAA